jgi:hypothetical protein
MRKDAIEDPIYAEFRRVWSGEGDDYMTRAEIAGYFNRSSYWVQWMFVKTNCKARTKSPKVRLREAGGADDRLDYINEMQVKSSLIAISKKIVARANDLQQIMPDNPLFSRRFSNMRRIISTTEQRMKKVKKLDSKWRRLSEVELAISIGKAALSEASTLVRK